MRIGTILHTHNIGTTFVFHNIMCNRILLFLILKKMYLLKLKNNITLAFLSVLFNILN